MTTTASVLADSVSREHIRLTTLELKYPKFIHGEFMTHRVFSRNASSSRAIPFERLVDEVINDPAMPVFWGKNQKGMQAREELADDELMLAKQAWRRARNDAVEHARFLHSLGAHKQIVNRIIEPYCHIRVVVTATDWANFFALRRHPDAQPEMKALADAMWEAQQASEPVLLQPGEWHLPYITEFDPLALDADDDLIKLSVARCARVSYKTHDGRIAEVEEDLKLYERLVGSTPLHASPAEHQATPDTPHRGGWRHSYQHGNLQGWRQYRKMLPNECVT